jgi:WhiB family redox-sensing transcriptional regulator
MAEDWQSKGACRGMDPNIFVTERGQPTAPAKRVCAQCSVRQECDDYATANYLQGVWGGRVHKVQRPREVAVVVTLDDSRPRKSG